MWKFAVLTFLVSASAGVNKSHLTPKDYILNESNGVSYKLVYLAATWDVARATCSIEGAKLTVPKSKEEFLFIQKMVKGMYYPDIIGAKYRHLVWVGVSNLEDYRVWKNVDGENINDTEFHDWSGGNGEDVWPDPKEPHCVGIDSMNPGYRQFWCHLAQPYICEKHI